MVTKDVVFFLTKDGFLYCLGFFEILDTSDEFLSHDASEWNSNDSFMAAKRKISGLAVVNDSAERAVALTKFANRTSKKENFFQNRLMSVVDNRNKVKTYRRQDVLN